MSFEVYCRCDMCGRNIAHTVHNKHNVNKELRLDGGYTYGGKHLCPYCNTKENKANLIKEVKADANRSTA